MNYQPGMLLAYKWYGDTYGVCKVVQVTETRKEPIISIVAYSNTFNEVPQQLNPDLLLPLVLHMPILLPAMENTGCVPVGEAEVKPEEMRGFETWLEVWKEKRAGFFDRSVPDSIDQVVEALSQVDGTGSSEHRDRLMRHWQQNRP